MSGSRRRRYLRIWGEDVAADIDEEMSAHVELRTSQLMRDGNAVVAAYDSAYGGYMDAVLGRDAARIRSVSAGITGALGAFGAVSTSTHSLALVRNE